MTNGNESAYPEVNHDNPQFNFPTYGLSKREYFAAMAMQGLLSEQYWASAECAAKYSVDMADALINALNNK